MNPHDDAPPDVVQPPADPSAGQPAPADSRPGPHRRDTTGEVVLYTPTQAAELLSVPESWLRRKAGQRRIASTKLGKHLRFSQADLTRIAADGAQTVRPTRSRLRST